MAHDPEGLRHWKVLRSAWQAANQNAREARFAVTKQFLAGKRPGDAELAEVDRLEAVADKFSVDLDNFVKIKLG